MAGLSSEPTMRRWHRRLLPAVAGMALLLAGGSLAACTARSGDPAAGGSAPATRSPSPSPSPTPPAGADITGPLDFLLVGIDPRESDPTWQPHADAVLLLHVSKELDKAYLFSLPRDLVVDIPAFSKAKFSGERTKLTHAMSYGSRVPGTDTPDTAQGLELLISTIRKYTEISRFDAAAVLNFRGMRELVDAVGGIDLYVDQRVASIHLRPDGSGRTRGASSTGYVGPQKVYEKGMQHLNGWQALDYGRQRYGLPAGDYDRTRHHRQLVKALVTQVRSLDMVANPGKLSEVLAALGKTLTFDGRGRQVAEFAYALRNLSPSAITLVDLPGTSVGKGSGYRGEQLTAEAKSFLTAIRDGTVDTFLTKHPKLVNAD